MENNISSNPLTETGNTGLGGGDILKQDIEKGNEIIKVQKANVFETANVEAQLNYFSSQVKDLSKAISDMMLNDKSWQKKIVQMLTSEIMHVADGNMKTPNFCFRTKSEQNVYIYNGLIWTPMTSVQAYYDFVKQCCENAGLPETQLADVRFMEKVYEQLAYRVSKELKQRIPSDEQWINLKNGVLVIKNDGSVKLRGHCRDDNFTYCLNFAYDPEATCPKWQVFLDEVLERGPQNDIAEFVGYTLTQKIKAEKILAFHGLGSNGKSVVMAIIKALLGEENVSEMDLGELSTNAEKRVQIEHKRLNISMESSDDINFANMKKLASGEPIDVRELYHGTRIISNYAKMMASYNVLPRAEATHGWFRRWILVPFNNIIPDEKQDIDLADKLMTELPGIFNWVLDALKAFLKRRKFDVSAESRAALKRYMQSSNSVMLYLSEECEITDCFDISGQELYKEYKNYSFDNNLKPYGRNKFFDMIEAAGVKRYMKRNKPWFKLRLTKDDDKPF